MANFGRKSLSAIFGTILLKNQAYSPYKRPMSLIIGRTENDESLRIVLNDSQYGVVGRKTKEFAINDQFWSVNCWHQIGRFQKNDFFLKK